jgi:hypothetical protein
MFELTGPEPELSKKPDPETKYFGSKILYKDESASFSLPKLTNQKEARHATLGWL